MSGMTIIKNDKYIEQVVSDNKNNVSELLYSQDGFEVIRYKMPKGTHGIFDAMDTIDETEIYYVLSGQILISPFNGPEEIIGPGDTMIISKSHHNYPFKVFQDSIFMCNSSGQIYDKKKYIIEKLNSLMTSLQEKDGHTKEHCIRVQRLSMKIAKELKIDDSCLVNLFQAARFHDIGKIMISTEILLKPHQLTATEKKIMETHPLESYKLVVEAFGEEIGQMVLQHHEMLDGSGYPYGLKGDKIKLGAKIITVSDVYDALVTQRPYCKALSPQQAVDILLKESGTHFDSDCINALISCLKHEHIL